MPPRVVDYRSDTLTQPTDAMRDAMRDAPVGDDVYGEDPTVNDLQALAARMLGKEAALFVPSGTMANEIAIGVHAPRGSEIIVDRESHIFLFEDAGPSVLWGVQCRTLEGQRGVFTARQVAEAIRGDDVHEPRSSMVSIENTHNLAGGTVWTPAQSDAVARVAHDHGMKVHVDGARLFNSAVAQDVTPSTLVKSADSVFIALSKGLSAPVGSIVAGSTEFIAQAVRLRKLLGGGMRQAGVIAAAGIVGLSSMIDRLAEDNANCHRLAMGLAKIPGFAIDLEAVQTNILFADVTGTGMPAKTLEGRLLAQGVKAIALDARRIRFVTHRHIARADVDWSLERIEAALRVKASKAARPASSPRSRQASR